MDFNPADNKASVEPIDVQKNKFLETKFFLKNLVSFRCAFYPPMVKSRRAEAMVMLNPATTSSKDIKVIIKKVDVPVGW